MISALEGFHHRIARQLTWWFPIIHGKGPDAEWEYPDMARTLEEAGLFPIRCYIARRQERLKSYTVADSQWYPQALTAAGPGHKMCWWDQHDYLDNVDNITLVVQ